MGDRIDEFDGAHLAAVTFGTVEMAARYRQHLDLPFPILADPDRLIYRNFDLGRGALHRIWGPGTFKLYARLLSRGRRMRRPTQDTRQLGGDFVIDADGRLVAEFRPDSPDTRPPIDDLVAAVAQARNP